MTTTGTWRDRWEERDRHGLKVLDVWERDGKPLAYEYEDTIYNYDNGATVFIDSLVGDLIPKPQPPRPKQYRPYTEEELWQQIQRNSGVLWVKGKEGCNRVLVTNNYTPATLHEHYTHLDGTPFGMEVGE